MSAYITNNDLSKNDGDVILKRQSATLKKMNDSSKQ